MGRPPNASRQTRRLFLAFAAEPRAWRHGYELYKETGLSSGTLYPALIRLHEQGLLESRWEDSAGGGRPPRHVYRLTARGLALARRLADEAKDVPFSPTTLRRS
jgi:PadR family transcriptional regulator, regulatory protein PadR